MPFLIYLSPTCFHIFLFSIYSPTDTAKHPGVYTSFYVFLIFIYRQPQLEREFIGALYIHLNRSPPSFSFFFKKKGTCLCAAVLLLLCGSFNIYKTRFAWLILFGNKQTYSFAPLFYKSIYILSPPPKIKISRICKYEKTALLFFSSGASNFLKTVGRINPLIYNRSLYAFFFSTCFFTVPSGHLVKRNLKTIMNIGEQHYGGIYIPVGLLITSRHE